MPLALLLALSPLVGGGPATNPPVFDPSTPCGQTLTATPNSQVSFVMSASDPDAGDIVRVAAAGAPPGSLFTPALPTLGNPAMSTFTWTPSNAQLGLFTITFSATDLGGNLTTCEVKIDVTAECFLVVGSGPGYTRFLPHEHEFVVQVEHVRAHYAVRLSDLPEFPLPPLAATPFAGPQLVLDVLGRRASRFSVQVVMWNPWQLPGNPEQWTSGLEVIVFPNGRVWSQPYGHSTGMQIFADVTTNAAGERVLRFPFTIPGI